MIHIAAGGTGLVTGAVALTVPKGQRLHRVVGTVFVASMLVMTAVGTAIAGAMREPMAFVPGLVTFYLVATGWAAVRPFSKGVRVEMAAGAAALAIAAVSVALAMASGSGGLGAVLAIFGVLAAFAGWRDLVVARAGGVVGLDRLGRHLWRLCAALAIAAFSFFLGQQDEFPQALRGPHNAIPAIAVLSAMGFWLVRLRRPGRRLSARTAG